ncbi:hypothetical protein [Frankia sp. Cj3]|uniref:hypothetical protein n=1 Tax=Frankia sp. Cj3 TaxID=2880976 RepID=UPI001EF5E7DA|nr:hypothetical protein [Frankia sp. Cj3]
MIIIVASVILCTPYLVSTLLRARRTRTASRVRPQQVGVKTRIGAKVETVSPDEPTWSALDDRQLTRLLIAAAPRATTE